jgi:O-acetyl-ADP-ribose deacetylase (regulator of RNase III)
MTGGRRLEMIESGSGNLLLSEVDALVNTVNTAGVMGKGVALQFKQAFPANYKAYRKQTTFPEQHVELAWRNLAAHSWLSPR